MAKLLKHFGLGGKKTPPQQGHSPQGFQARAQGTDRISGVVGDSGRFGSYSEDARRLSEFSADSLCSSFDARTKERDWSLRGQGQTESPGNASPADCQSRDRSSPAATVLPDSVQTADDRGDGAQKEEALPASAPNSQVKVSEYVDPFDSRNGVAKETAVTEKTNPESRSDYEYSVPYEFKDLQVTAEPIADVRPKYYDPYACQEMMPAVSVQPSDAPVETSHYRNLPLVSSAAMTLPESVLNATRAEASARSKAETRWSASDADGKVAGLNLIRELPNDINGRDDDDDDHENYIDLQEEEIILPRSGIRQEGDTWRTASPSLRAACIDSGVYNYDEPWDLANTTRDLEARLLAAQNFDPPRSHGSDRMSRSIEATDDRPQEGYDKPWDLQPHMKDDRGQEGYDKPWDLKPHMKDLRPSQEYDVPWDKKMRDIEKDLIAAKKAKDAAAKGGGASAAAGQPAGRSTPRLDSSRLADTRPGCEYDEPWDQKRKQIVSKVSDHAQKSGHSSGAGLPFQQVPGHSSSSWGRTMGERIDPKLPLKHQSWYHGAISRLDAENLLCVHREGSYLVRTSESNQDDFSLSVKSIRGFMHMKIVKNAEGRYILGQFSQPFVSIPQMIHHYTVNKLPIKGAEHMSLMYPVSNELL